MRWPALCAPFTLGASHMHRLQQAALALRMRRHSHMYWNRAAMAEPTNCRYPLPLSPNLKKVIWWPMFTGVKNHLPATGLPHVSVPN